MESKTTSVKVKDPLHLVYKKKRAKQRHTPAAVTAHLIYLFFLNNLYLKSLPFLTINISSVELLLLLIKNIYTYLHIELWKCDLLKATTSCDPARSRTRDLLAYSPGR